MRVTDGQNEFYVEPAQITNDLDLAARVFDADQSVQAAIKSMGAQQAQAYARKQEADEKVMAASMKAQQASNSQPLPVSGGNPLNQTGYDRQGSSRSGRAIH